MTAGDAGWWAEPWAPCLLGESPFWDARSGQLVWIDIARHAALRATPGGACEVWPLPAEPGCIVPAAAGGFVLALRSGVWHASAWGAALQGLAQPPYDPALQRFNDGRCDAQGRLWLGTLVDARQPADAALWCLEAGALRRMADGATVGNGCAFAPDGATLYWADTTAHTVRAWDRDAQGNALSRSRVFFQCDPKPAGWDAALAAALPGSHPVYGGRPDGAAVDTAGNYWVALYEGGRILCLSPDGAVLEDIAVPARCPTMPCFGGDDLRTLFVTTVRDKRPAEELAAFPDSGCVFARRVAVPGLRAHAFDG